MKILVVGGGGREHAIIDALSKSPKVDALFACPGNGGISKLATCLPVDATDIEGVIKAYQSGEGSMPDRATRGLYYRGVQ